MFRRMIRMPHSDGNSMKVDIKDIRLEAVQAEEMSGDDAVVIASLIARWILSRLENPDEKQRDPGRLKGRRVKELP